jgi:hypothetical protein
MIPKLYTALGLDLNEGDPARRLAAGILMAGELEHFKRTNGYLPGIHFLFRDSFPDGGRPHWPEVCRTWAGASDSTVIKWTRARKAVLIRLRRRKEDADIVKALEVLPSKLSAKRRTWLVDRLAERLHGLTLVQFAKGVTRKKTPAPAGAITAAKLAELAADLHRLEKDAAALATRAAAIRRTMEAAGRRAKP